MSQSSADSRNVFLCLECISSAEFSVFSCWSGFVEGENRDRISSHFYFYSVYTIRILSKQLYREISRISYGNNYRDNSDSAVKQLYEEKISSSIWNEFSSAVSSSTKGMSLFSLSQLSVDSSQCWRCKMHFSCKAALKTTIVPVIWSYQ